MPCPRTQHANLPACSPQPSLNAERQAGKLRMPFLKVIWYDSTRGMNPRSTDCEAGALTTTPSLYAFANHYASALHICKVITLSRMKGKETNMFSNFCDRHDKHCLRQHFLHIGVKHTVQTSVVLFLHDLEEYIRRYFDASCSRLSHFLLSSFGASGEVVVDLAGLSRGEESAAPLRLPVRSSLYVHSTADNGFAHDFVNNPTIY